MNKGTMIGIGIAVVLLIAIVLFSTNQFSVLGEPGGEYILEELTCNTREDCITQMINNGMGSEESIQEGIDNGVVITCEDVCVVRT